MAPKPGTYDNGRQDAWIESIRVNCGKNVDRIMHRLDLQAAILSNLSAKVNHVYGGALMLGAVAGVVISTAVAVVGIVLSKGSP